VSVNGGQQAALHQHEGDVIQASHGLDGHRPERHNVVVLWRELMSQDLHGQAVGPVAGVQEALLEIVDRVPAGRAQDVGWRQIAQGLPEAGESSRV